MRLLKGDCEHHDLAHVGDRLSVLNCDGLRSENNIRLWILEDYYKTLTNGIGPGMVLMFFTMPR
ncbi:hypothetical protein Pyn_40712 [Prunus yedoensis var. nudiflora]|uniref:Uncharacterized protein n=1 Tax=Prunus yedoensis var. nudiflora TaxID=2094558 RepID=A0A314ZA43_PRUYE|nr:hypothetical protein Pyn_40712 [Prunus yedoensis var. nudiflora]